MIGQLRGHVTFHKQEAGQAHLLVDVGGVGYLVQCSLITWQALRDSGAPEGTLFIHTHVREDHIHLFGFVSEAEQSWFLQLIGVNGVGPKLALGILSILSPTALSAALLSQDKTAFTPISGVGPKLATRLLNELKDKATSLTEASLPATSSTVKQAPGAESGISTSLSEAVSALENLGYNRSEAFTTIQRLSQADPELGLEALIRQGLQELARV